MWRNTAVAEFVDWLRAWNADRDPGASAGFHGLDLYSMYASMAAVLRYLDETDPGLARIARERYACLTPWADDPAGYGHAATRGNLAACEAPVLAMLQDLLRDRFTLMEHDGDRFFDAERNARVVASAEQYYRLMYDGAVASWNLRDGHMFETLQALLDHYGPASRGVVWAHNSHVGNAEATAMGARGEHNIGSLCRWSFGDSAFLVGFGTDHGTVAAASDWDGPMDVKRVRPAQPDSYERLCDESGLEAFLLHLSRPARGSVREELREPRLERAIGVIYRPESELQSHYIPAVLPEQFDSWIWFDETTAVTPLPVTPERGRPDTYPFGV
jgi:protein-L-isoaspartate(D-aspartate) O-methyltransferase